MKPFTHSFNFKMRKKGKPEKMKKCVKITQQAYGKETGRKGLFIQSLVFFHKS
jgi:hypothetical protein